MPWLLTLGHVMHTTSLAPLGEHGQDELMGPGLGSSLTVVWLIMAPFLTQEAVLWLLNGKY